MQVYSLGALSPRSFSVGGATNATPIVVATTASHSFVNGDIVTLVGVVGNTNANGTFVASIVDATHVLLIGSAGNSAYASGGTISAPTQLAFAPNDGNRPAMVQRILFMPRVSNTKVVFAGLAGLNQLTASEVIREMNPNTSSTGGRLDYLSLEEPESILNLPDYWIDCTVPTESVVVSYWRR